MGHIFQLHTFYVLEYTLKILLPSN